MRYNIMVVDNEAIITTQLEERLTSMGYTVKGSASSGEEAVEMARHIKPDIILMDIVMPGRIDGIDASEIIKKEMDIPIIFLTAYADDKFVRKAKIVEPFGYIVKPFQENEIKAVIELAIYKKNIERSLHQSEEKYRLAVENAGEAIILIDNKGNIISLNHKAETMFCYTEKKLIGKPFISILPKRFRKNIKIKINHIISTKKLNITEKITECSWVKNDGTKFPVEFSLTVCKTGEDTFFTIIARDITKQNKLYEQLIHSKKMSQINHFTNEMANELNNLFVVIQAHAQLSLKEKHIDNEIKKSLQAIEEVSKQGSNIVKKYQDLYINEERDYIKDDNA